MVHWWLLTGVSRLLVGGILLTSALGKSLDLPGFVEVLVTCHAIPMPLLWPAGLTITGLEWLLGVWILSGRRLATGTLAVAVLYSIYALWMAVGLLRGLDLPNCGCYGVFYPQPLRWYSPLEDLAVVGMCYALWSSGSKTKAPH